MAKTTHQTMTDDELLDMVDFYHYIRILISQTQAVLHEEILKTISPSFQVDANTNAVLAKSVQLTVDHLAIVCGASTQGNLCSRFRDRA